MKLIQPNCRLQFSKQDIHFIFQVLGRKVRSAEALTKLLADEQSRDLILDDPALFSAVLEHTGWLRISTHLYFYILVRHVLRRSGIDNREVADYVAEVLAEFSDHENTVFRFHGRPIPLEYLVDMLAALDAADDATAFSLRAHIGNQSLFLAGVFPAYLRHRAERRGSPGLEFYEEIGRANYRAASDHRLAYKYNLAGIFETLAIEFQLTRRALNDLAERLLALGEFDSAAEVWLSRALRN